MSSDGGLEQLLPTSGDAAFLVPVEPAPEYPIGKGVPQRHYCYCYCIYLGISYSQDNNANAINASINFFTKFPILTKLFIHSLIEPSNIYLFFIQ